MTTRRTTTKVQVPIQNAAQAYKENTTDVTPLYSTASPFLPTGLESLLLAIYPLTLVFGSLISYVSPASRAATYDVDYQAYRPSEAPSYFAKKSNIFNVYFVKIGWLWVTLAFFAFIFTHPSFGRPFSATPTRRRRHAVLRYLSVTLVWTFVTQWFFGPAIIDRSFRWTGGQCGLVEATEDGSEAGMSDARHVLTHAACRAVGGQWRGGHDISGHVFLLILGSAMLWLESLPVVLRTAELREKRKITTADGRIRDAGLDASGDDRGAGAETTIGARAPLVVAGLSWWMLLMTAAYFHTWFEKFTGFLVASLTIFTVYFLPRGLPILRDLLGMPAAPAS